MLARSLAGLSLAACAAIVGVAPAFAQVSVPREEGLVEVVAERLPPLTLVVLVDSAGAVLLPVRETLAYLGYTPVLLDGRFEVPGLAGTRALLDTRAGIVAVGRDTIVLAPAELAVEPQATYLRAERLAVMLQAQAAYDAASLSLTLTRSVPFPAQQRILAEQRRAMLLAQSRHRERDEGAAVGYPLVTGAGVVDWEVATLGLDPTSRNALRLRGAAALLGGELSAGASADFGRQAEAAIRDPLLAYHRVFPGNRVLTQVRAGNIVTTGVFSRYLRGVELSNRPFLRDLEVGAILLRPDLPAGWEYEVFQGNQLLGFSEPGDPAGVAVPLRGGATPVQVRMLGPAGEEVTTTLLYQAPVSLLPEGRFEYAVGGGRCEGLVCRRYAHADVRYGATSLLTVGGGFEHAADSTAHTTRPYGVASFTSGTLLTGELQLVHRALYTASLGVFPWDDAAVRLRASRSRPGFGPVSVVSPNRERWDLEITWDERLYPGETALFEYLVPFSSVRFGGAISTSAEHGVERWRLSSGGSFSHGHGEVRLDHDAAAARASTLSARASLFVPVRWEGVTYRPMFNAAAGVGSIGVRLLEAGASIQPRDHYVLHSAIVWSREARKPALTLAWSARLGGVQGTVRAVRGRPGASTAAVVSGSTGINGFRQLNTRPNTLSGHGGLYGVVFLDLDGDGVFSPGDLPAPDIPLLAGGYSVASDSLGRYSIWGLRPYAVTPIAVDGARVPDPSWTTADPTLRVRPAPSAARRVDIPLVRTRELIGSVVADAGVATNAGVTLILTRLDDGAASSLLTFSDGQFYLGNLRPGSYRIEVAPSSLAALGARADPAAIDFQVPSAFVDPVVELPPIALKPQL